MSSEHDCFFIAETKQFSDFRCSLRVKGIEIQTELSEINTQHLKFHVTGLLRTFLALSYDLFGTKNLKGCFFRDTLHLQSINYKTYEFYYNNIFTQNTLIKVIHSKTDSTLTTDEEGDDLISFEGNESGRNDDDNVFDNDPVMKNPSKCHHLSK